jgi:hypothetical protein
MSALTHTAGFGDQIAYATLVYVNAHANKFLEFARQLLKNSKTRNYVTKFDNLLITRFLSSDPRQLREDFFYCYRKIRSEVCSLPDAVPGMWG